MERMTDEELLYRLRDLGLHSPSIAADRIEELLNENKLLKANVDEFHEGEKLWAKERKQLKAENNRLRDPNNDMWAR